MLCTTDKTEEAKARKPRAVWVTPGDTGKMKKAWRPWEGQEAMGRPGGQGMEAKGRHWTATLGGKMPGAQLGSNSQ